MKSLRVVISCLPLFAGCATVANYPGAQETAATWDQMKACAKEASGNPLKAQCDEKFKDTPLTVKLRKVDLLTSRTIMLMTDFGDGSRNFNCLLDSSQYKDQVAKLSPGDIITIQGRLKELSVYAGGGSMTSFMSIDPCTLSKPPAP